MAFVRADVGRRIRELRGFGMTQKEFAQKLGVSQGMVSKLERGDGLSVELLVRLSEVIGCSVDWLLKGE